MTNTRTECYFLRRLSRASHLQLAIFHPNAGLRKEIVVAEERDAGPGSGLTVDPTMAYGKRRGGTFSPKK